LASWKVAQELARSEQESKPDLSIKGSEPDVEAQRAAIASWNKAHELAKGEPVSANISVRVLSPESRYRAKTIPSSEGSFRASSPEGQVKIVSPEAKRVARNRTWKPRKTEKGKENPTKGTPDPVRMMVDKAIAQDKSHRERHKTPRVMEPVEQIDPRSYIGLAFKRLGSKDKQTYSPNDSSSDDSSSDESSSPPRHRKRKGKRNSPSNSSSSDYEPSKTSTEGQSSDSDETPSSSSSDGRR